MTVSFYFCCRKRINHDQEDTDNKSSIEVIDQDVELIWIITLPLKKRTPQILPLRRLVILSVYAITIMIL